MFKSVYFKLTLLYVVIIMTISLFFSVLYYHSEVADLNQGLQRQADAINRVESANGIFFAPHSLNDPIAIINQQLQQNTNHVIWELVYVNLIILLGGAGTSYFLAKYSIQPVQDAMEEQARFTADASHELRTPLTALRTETEVLLRDKKASAAELKEQLASNLEEVGKLERLSAALLTLANHEHAARLSFEPVEVQTIWQEAVGSVERKLKEHNSEISISSNDPIVKGNRDMLVELVVIFLDNALKYSKPGSPIELSSKIEGHTVSLIIRDHGQGIHASDLPYIFNRFYRSDRSRSGEQKGYGLGLSIAKQIVEQHNGRIDVESRPGVGTTFFARLPRA